MKCVFKRLTPYFQPRRLERLDPSRDLDVRLALGLRVLWPKAGILWDGTRAAGSFHNSVPAAFHILQCRFLLARFALETYRVELGYALGHDHLQ